MIQIGNAIDSKYWNCIKNAEMVDLKTISRERCHENEISYKMVQHFSKLPHAR